MSFRVKSEIMPYTEESEDCLMLKVYKGRSSNHGYEIRNETFNEAKCQEWCMKTELCAAAEYNVFNRTCIVHAFSQVNCAVFQNP